MPIVAKIPLFKAYTSKPENRITKQSNRIMLQYGNAFLEKYHVESLEKRFIMNKILGSCQLGQAFHLASVPYMVIRHGKPGDGQ